MTWLWHEVKILLASNTREHISFAIILCNNDKEVPPI